MIENKNLLLQMYLSYIVLFVTGKPHLAMTGEPRSVSRVVAGFSSFDGEYSLPHVLGQGSPIFHSSLKGELGIALESLQGKIDLI